jgi:hypothetical protein
MKNENCEFTGAHFFGLKGYALYHGKFEGLS